MSASNLSDSPKLGVRVFGRRGGYLPGLAATLKVAELPNQRNGQLVLVYDSEGNGRYLHPSLTHTGRWCLGSREVAFATETDDVSESGSSPAQGAGVPELHLGAEQQGLSGVWVTCGCGFATTRQTARLAEAAWTEYRAHALDALRESVRVAYATHPLTGSSSDRGPVTDRQRDEVFELVQGTDSVWRQHPSGGTFTDADLDGSPFYVRLFGSSSGAVGYTPRFGTHVERRLTPYQVACLQGLVSR